MPFLALAAGAISLGKKAGIFKKVAGFLKGSGKGKARRQARRDKRRARKDSKRGINIPVQAFQAPFANEAPRSGIFSNIGTGLLNTVKNNLFQRPLAASENFKSSPLMQVRSADFATKWEEKAFFLGIGKKKKEEEEKEAKTKMMVMWIAIGAGVLILLKILKIF